MDDDSLINGAIGPAASLLKVSSDAVVYMHTKRYNFLALINWLSEA